MKCLLSLLSLLLFVNVFAQIDDLEKANQPCFQKTLDRTKLRKENKSRYVEWECGQKADIIDCNSGLELDPESNRVYTRGGDGFQATGKLYTGYCESCHNNGTRKRLVYFEEGLQDGKDTTTYPSGCPQVITSFVNGVENGQWVYYFDSSGYEAWEINYVNAKKHGKSIYFKQFPNGKSKEGYPLYTRDTLKIEHHTNGVLDGVRKEFFKDSKLKREVNYKMGKFHGAFKIYNKDGVLLEDLNFENGEKIEEQKYFYDNGAPLRTENWKKGVKEGNFTTFYIQGNVQSIENYKKGLKEGWFEERFPDNSIKRRALYKKDELIEEHVFDKYGNEIKTFRVEPEENQAEDDAMPTEKKKKAFWKRNKKKKDEE